MDERTYHCGTSWEFEDAWDRLRTFLRLHDLRRFSIASLTHLGFGSYCRVAILNLVRDAEDLGLVAIDPKIQAKGKVYRLTAEGSRTGNSGVPAIVDEVVVFNHNWAEDFLGESKNGAVFDCLCGEYPPTQIQSWAKLDDGIWRGSGITGAERKRGLATLANRAVIEVRGEEAWIDRYQLSRAAAAIEDYRRKKGIKKRLRCPFPFQESSKGPRPETPLPSNLGEPKTSPHASLTVINGGKGRASLGSANAPPAPEVKPKTNPPPLRLVSSIPTPAGVQLTLDAGPFWDEWNVVMTAMTRGRQATEFGHKELARWGLDPGMIKEIKGDLCKEAQHRGLGHLMTRYNSSGPCSWTFGLSREGIAYLDRVRSVVSSDHIADWVRACFARGGGIDPSARAVPVLLRAALAYTLVDGGPFFPVDQDPRIHGNELSPGQRFLGCKSYEAFFRFAHWLESPGYDWWHRLERGGFTTWEWLCPREEVKRLAQNFHVPVGFKVPHLYRWRVDPYHYLQTMPKATIERLIVFPNGEQEEGRPVPR